MVNYYSKLSAWGKILLFIFLFLILIIAFKPFKGYYRKEGFENGEQVDKFLFKSSVPDIYDSFYADIYDYLVFNNLKNEYEVGEIINKTSATNQSVVLDIGSGTGHHVALLSAKGIDAIGMDISPSMVKQAKLNYPDYKFELGDVLDVSQFQPNTFTHITCLYFTIYYMQDKRAFFENCMKWLMPGGYFIVHVVNRELFDPILPPGNPLLLVSPQRYAKKRITSTSVKFNDFTYKADFKIPETGNPEDDKVVSFVENFKNDHDGKTRKNEHTLYMESEGKIVQLAQETGFIIHSKIDLLHCQYEYQYLYVFVKPN
ncbi:class I SAM-dependent methyltransferase [bacterium]|nr:class I SAM-dependent methyltransferase [bacterium]